MRHMVGSRVEFERSDPSSHRTAHTRAHGDTCSIDRSACSRGRDDRPGSRGANQIAPSEGWAHSGRLWIPTRAPLYLWNSKKLAFPFAESLRRSLAPLLAPIASH